MSDYNDGHRARLDKKSNIVGFENLEEHEQLEKFLFAVEKRRDTNKLAHRLIERFGGLYGVLSASVDDLVKVEGVGNRMAQVLHDIYDFMGSAERSKLCGGKNFPVFKTMEDIGNYAKTLFYNKLTENLYMVSLNSRYMAYRFNNISRGSSQEAPVYIPEILKLALRNEANAVVIAHNHPSGNLTPSQADIDITIDLYNGFRAIEIEFVDHIIVGGGEYVSMKELGIF